MKELDYGKEYRYDPSYAHPVHNEFLPVQVASEKILKKEGDLEGKVWDEKLLREWEWQDNAGDDWEGRPPKASR